MEWWRKAVVVPVKRAWIGLTARLRRKRDGSRGVLVKLHDDIQTCSYEDVRVMWEILKRSETEKLTHGSSKSARTLVWLGRPSSRRHRTVDLQPQC